MASPDQVMGPEAYIALRDRFDDHLRIFLRSHRQQAEWIDARATLLFDEVIRLVEAGGKRLRPLFCYWGYRAAGAAEDLPILKAGAALELLHTFALIHDDLIDGSRERRGVHSTHLHMEEEARSRGQADAQRLGLAGAVLCGDLAAVLADELLLEAGFPPMVLARALALYHEMRVELATGQVLGLLGPRPADEIEAKKLASMKGGAYTVERPLLIGATLAGGTMQLQAVLSRYGTPLGQAFQLRDDLLDDPALTPVSKENVAKLITQAKDALDDDVVDPEAVRALRALAEMVALG